MTWVNPFDAVSLGGDAAPLVVTEPVTIRATTTAPTKPTATPILDYITVVDDGSGWCNLSMNLSYETSLAGANPGSGIYLFALPGAYQFDLGYHTPSPDTVQAFTNQIMLARTIPGSRGLGARLPEAASSPRSWSAPVGGAGSAPPPLPLANDNALVIHFSLRLMFCLGVALFSVVVCMFVL